MPLAEPNAPKLRSVSIKVINPKTVATANCKNTTTLASIFCARTPVVIIWQANSSAQSSVSKSPSLNEIPVEKLNDKIPIPSKHKKEEIKILRLGRFLLMIHHKNGTITTLDAVMNALLDGVVYCSPTV